MSGKARFPHRLRRAESFLGIHFDFHAGADCREVGRRVTRGMVGRIIAAVRPDYIQCDCKGHPGISSYPTKVGHPAPGFVRDQLRIWRQVTAERGVALYMHYSGVWDSAAIKRHPSWARVDEKGKRDPNNTSVFGPYVDRLLIPQLKELSDEYGVDGVWVDGDCWAAQRDYSRRALAEFRRRTGIRSVPRKPEDPHFREFTDFCREGFRRYLRRYVDALHRHNPSFQVASNWAYSSMMPEPPAVGVDFISGDYTPLGSLNSARWEARCMAPQGRPWDLMAWSFAGKFGEGAWSTKTAAQLKQEAAVVLAAGGGFQAYFQQRRDGSVPEWSMKLMAEAARFCRARQKFCHRAKAVPQIALLNSTAGEYRSNPRLFGWGPASTKVAGVLRCLLESQQSVEVLAEHHLAGRMGEYPLIVVPERDGLPAAFRRELAAYVRGGGRLLLVGPAAAAMFAKQLRVKLPGKPEEQVRYLAQGGWLAGWKSVCQPAKLLAGARAFGALHEANDPESPSAPAASIARCGRGRIAAVYFSLGERYGKARNSVVRDFLGALVRELFPRPVAEVAGSHSVDVSVNQLDGRLMVNLVNTAGPHGDEHVHVFDEIPPVGPLEVAVRLKRRPRRITLQPEGRVLAFRFRRGEVRLTLERLAIHEVIAVGQ